MLVSTYSPTAVEAFTLGDGVKAPIKRGTILKRVYIQEVSKAMKSKDIENM